MRAKNYLRGARLDLFEDVCWEKRETPAPALDVALIDRPRY